jgi:hypothetical protein
VLPEHFAVLDQPWNASRVVAGIERFLQGSTSERVPEQEADAAAL